MSQKQRILELLQDNPDGVSNEELHEIGWRYVSRIDELRNEGHNIESKHIKEWKWNFKLIN